jgi:hypothetical protein
MMKNAGLLCAILLFASVSLDAAETHARVQEALDWELPVNGCKKPRVSVKIADLEDYDGVKTVYDSDTYIKDREFRKERSWKACVKRYKKTLLQEFEDLKNCAQYGLTEAQASTILGKMALIQAVMLSPGGVVEEEIAEQNMR